MNATDFSIFSKRNCNRITECNSFVSEELEAEEDEIRRNEEVTIINTYKLIKTVFKFELKIFGFCRLKR